MEKNTILDDLIILLTRLNFSLKDKPNLLFSLVQKHLSMLRIVYLSMREVDFYEKVTSLAQGEKSISEKELALGQPFDSFKTRLNYFQMIYILTQFGRVLEKHKLVDDISKFPGYYRIKFYRNCVVEHWEDYVQTISNEGFTFKKGKAAIPIVETVFLFKDRQDLQEELTKKFADNKVKLSLPDRFKSSMISSDKEYCETIYTSFEKINGELPTKYGRNLIPQDLIEILFKVGFPAPISDVEEYLTGLVSYLTLVIEPEIAKM